MSTSDTPGSPAPAPEPPTGSSGRVLDRAPGDRYRASGGPSDRPGPTTGAASAPTAGSQPGAGSAGLATLAGLGVAGAGAIGNVVLAGVLSMTTGLLALSALVGWLVGTAVARLSGPRLGRGGRVGLAVALVAIGVLAGAIGTWLYARAEGGVLGPVDYLLETFGLIMPAQFVLGAIVAAWSAR